MTLILVSSLIKDAKPFPNSVEELKEMGVQKMGKRLLVMKKLKSLIHKGQNGSVTGSAGSGTSRWERWLGYVKVGLWPLQRAGGSAPVSVCAGTG